MAWCNLLKIALQIVHDASHKLKAATHQNQRIIRRHKCTFNSNKYRVWRDAQDFESDRPCLGAIGKSRAREY